MEETSRLNIPYPSRYTETWWDDFVATMNSLDSNIFAEFEDRNLPVTGGGSVFWSGNDLTWSEDIEIISPAHGQKQTITAGAQSIARGEFLYVTLSRGPTTEVSVSFAVASTVPISGNNKALAYCDQSDNLWFWNGLMLADGTGSIGFSSSGAGQVIWTRQATAVTVTAGNVTIVGVTDNSAPRVITLPSAKVAIDGYLYLVKVEASGGSAVTVDTEGAESIDGLASQTLGDRASIGVYAGDGEWHIAFSHLLGGESDFKITAEIELLETINVGDVVLINSSGKLILASFDNSSRMPAIGVAVAVAGPNLLNVAVGHRVVRGVFSGLTPGARYMVGASGAIFIQGAISLVGKIAQTFGTAVSSDTMIMEVDSATHTA